MAFTYGFYNSSSGDRVYDAVQISQIFDGVINDGVYQKIGDAFGVTATGTDLNVSVLTGRAWFDHTWNLNDSALSIAIPAGHPTLNRIDSIILEVDSSTRTNVIKRLAGSAASTPVPPTLTKTSTLNQYRLADVYIGLGVTVIRQQDITYKVGTDDCPLVTGPLEVISIDSWVDQWEAEWEAWFNYIIGELDTEVAGNLQNQITAIRGDNNPPLTTILALKTHTHTSGIGDPISSNGLADNSVTPSKILNRTRSFLVPVSYNLWGSHIFGAYGTDLPYTEDVDAYGFFQVPSDFVSGMTVKAILRANAGGNMYGNAYASYLADGQGSPHSNSIANTAVGLFVGITTHAYSISLTNAAIGDHVSIRLTRLGGSYPTLDTIQNYIYLMGWYVEYTADS